MRVSRAALAAALVGLGVASAAEAVVPITVARSGHATVPVDVEGHGVQQFVFDTGAEASAVYAATAESWKLPRRPAPGQGGGEAGGAEVAVLPALELDGVEISGLTAAVLPPRADGVPLVGVVGLDLVGGLLVDFNYPAKQLALLPPNVDAGALAGQGVEPLTATALEGGILTVPVTVGTGTQATAVIHTGVRQSQINPKLAQALGIAAGAAGFAPVQLGQAGSGAPVSVLAGQLRGVQLGGVRLDRAPVIAGDLPLFKLLGVDDRPAIILGLDWLSSARMIVDFPGRRVWFAPVTRDRL